MWVSKSVLCIKDYWQRRSKSFVDRSGDHIDLWDKDEITGSGMFMRSIYELFGVAYNLNKSKGI